MHAVQTLTERVLSDLLFTIRKLLVYADLDLERF